MATGTGKTNTFICFMHVIQELSANPAICPEGVGGQFPANPVMLVICPTNTLEAEMVCSMLASLARCELMFNQEEKMTASGLHARAVNRDTVQLAQKDNMNLYKEIVTGATIVLVSPEQLLTQRFEAAISDKDFAKRVCVMAVDEVHLLNTWGKSFRKSYLQVGWAWAHLKNAVPLIAMTATLQGGKNTEDICTFLGLQANLHVIHRSNLRRDFRIIFHTMMSNPESSDAFPELDWVLSSRCKVLIHHWSIATCWRIATYLIKGNASDPYHTVCT